MMELGVRSGGVGECGDSAFQVCIQHFVRVQLRTVAREIKHLDVRFQIHS